MWGRKDKPSAGEGGATVISPPTDDTVPVIRTIAMPADANPAGDIFGGWLMSQMDLAASSVATRRAEARVVTVAVDAMAFLNPVMVGDEVSLYGHLVSTGRTSMKVLVEAWRRDRHHDEMTKVTQGTFTFVAIGADRRPRPLP
jgi:acyl-CoA thioesterase YciA